MDERQQRHTGRQHVPGRFVPRVNPVKVDPTMVTRFWSQIERRGPTECWPWTGYVEKGYGRFYDGVRMVGAHDLAVRWSTGEMRREDHDTCHSCHNPICCNPAHLRYASRRSNVTDAVGADRHARGSRNGHAKLTEDDVVVIRERAAAGATGRQMARDYEVSEGTVNMILSGKRWAHAGGPIRPAHGNRKHGRYAK